MKIEEITTNHKIKISPNSITVKDYQRNKTVGVIIGIRTLQQIPFREQIPFYNKLHKTNIPRKKINYILNSCVFVDNEIYYFYDLFTKTNVESWEAAGYPTEPELKQLLKEEHRVNETLRDNNIHVIECYINEDDDDDEMYYAKVKHIR